MLDQLGNAARGTVAPLLARWEGFCNKVWERFSAVAAEAEPGIDQVIAVDPLNSNAVSAALSVLEARLRGLSDKVQEAESKVSDEWGEAIDDLEVTRAEQTVLRRLSAQIISQSRQLQRQIGWQGELLAIKKGADWARALYAVAQREWSERQCANCGGPIQLPFVHAASSVTCTHCNAVSSVLPGPATGLYFQGIGVHNLAREAVKDAWLNEKQGETWLNGLRHPTEEDRERFLVAARAHWVAHYQVVQKLDPGFGATPEQAAEDKMRHYTAWDHQSDVNRLRAFGDLIRRARARDINGCAQLIQQAGLDPEEAVEAVHERGDRDGTSMLLEVEYRLGEVDEAKQAWVAQRLAEMDERLANR